MPLELYPYTDTWEPADPHANFKGEVAQYTLADPLVTLNGLSEATGVPVGCLARYVLVKYAASGADMALATGPLVLRQMEDQIEKAEIADTDAARLQAYKALKQMISWLRVGMGE
jgi:hypothetical protein